MLSVQKYYAKSIVTQQAPPSVFNRDIQGSIFPSLHLLNYQKRVYQNIMEAKCTR